MKQHIHLYCSYMMGPTNVILQSVWLHLHYWTFSMFFKVLLLFVYILTWYSLRLSLLFSSSRGGGSFLWFS